MAADLFKCASQLTAEHIGLVVRFLVTEKTSNIEKIITAELDSVAHNRDAVLVTIGAKFAADGKEVYRLPRAQVVHIGPPLYEVKEIAKLREGMPR